MFKEPTTIPKYIGNFREQMQGFIIEKRAVGYKYSIEAHILLQFDRFSLDFPDETLLSKFLVSKWNEKRSYEKERNHLTRISVIRQFAIYMQNHDEPAFVTPKAAKGRSHQYIPYIFTEAELTRIFNSADTCRYSPISKHQHLFVPIIFRLLYGCGLRVSEALSLKICDVDLENGILTVNKSKLGKSRYVPMSSTLTERMLIFKKQVLLGKNDDEFFFTSPTGGRYSNRNIYSRFRDLLRLSGISHGGRGKGPRVHDFRHTFAVHCLKKWVLNGIDINAAIPYLSTFLGHDSFDSTQYYLRLTADIFPVIVQMIDNKHADIVPVMEDICI